VTTSNEPISILGSLTANHLVHIPFNALLVVAVYYKVKPFLVTDVTLTLKPVSP